MSILIGWNAACAATLLENPSKEDVLEEVSNFTGLTKDALSLALDETPGALDQLGDTLLALKVLNSLCEARDADALADIFDYAFGKLVDKLKEKAFPNSINVFLTAFTVYKTSLEVIRDYYYVPKFDDKIYQRYRQQRLEDLRRQDTSEESKTTAFEAATTQKDSGYYVVKQKMYDEMVKAKGYVPDQIGDKVSQDLWNKINTFWISRMEAKLQQDILQEQRPQIESQIWGRAQGLLDALKKKAAGAAGPERLFFSKAKPPRGWKVSQKEDSLKALTPAHDPNMNYMFQRFTLIPQAFVEKVSGSSVSCCWTADGKNIPSEQNRWLTLHIYISPAQYVIAATGYQMDMKARLADMGKAGAFDSMMKIIKEFKADGVDLGYIAQEQYNGEWRRKYQCEFVKGNWDVNIVAWGHPNFMAQDKDAVGQIAAEIAARIANK